MAQTKVRQGGSRPRSQVRATANAEGIGVAERRDAGPAAPQRVVVGTIRNGKREVASERPANVRGQGAFEGQRNQVLDVSEANIRESVETEDRVIVAADQATGGAMVIESSDVIGGGRTAAGGARRAAPQAARAPRAAGAQWMGADPGKARDQVLENPVGDLQDQEAVGSDDLIVRAAQPGAAAPTGEPCTCAYEWDREVDEAGDEVVTVYGIGGLATGFRGAPRYMTWCIICGGERDGQFRPSNAIRYGGQAPEPPRPVSAEAIAQQVLARVQSEQVALEPFDKDEVVGEVMNQVGEYLGSDRFLDLLAEKIANKTKVAAGA